MQNRKKDHINLCISKIKETWSRKNTNFLLGEWCLEYPDQKLQEYKIKKAKPFCINQKLKDIHYKRARNIEERFLDYLITSLNDIHKTSFGKRFWKIILGHWVRRYVSIIYNRVISLNENINNNEAYLFVCLKSNDYYMHTTNSSEIIWMANDDVWNNLLYQKIFHFSKFKNISFQDINYNKKINTNDPNKKIFGLKRNLKFFIYNVYNFVMSLIYKDNDPVIINTYMPLKFEFLLQLKLKIFPRYFKNNFYNTSIKTNENKRDYFYRKYKKKFDNDLDNCLYNIVWFCLPICFLEGFSELNYRTNKLRWPKNPKFIFTSNEFDSNEYFKFYTALKTENNSKYFVGQHGAGYGTHRYDTPLIEEETSDKFLCWGWGKNNSKYFNVFSFLNLRKKIKREYIKKKDCLMIFQNLGTRIEIEDLNYEYKVYWNSQLNFISLLSHNVYQNLNLRLFNLTPWNELERLKNFDSDLNVHCKFDKNFIPLEKILQTTKIVIVTFDTTVILELLINDIPFIGFWPNTLEKIRDSALPYYKNLIDNDLLFETPEDAAKKVNEIWNNVDSWWNEESRLNARKKYMKKFCKTSNTSINNLKDILLNE